MNSISILFLSILYTANSFSGYSGLLELEYIAPSSFCFQSFHWEIRYYYDGFLFIFSLATFNIFSSVHFNVLTVAYYEEFLLWSCLFGILCVSCAFLGRSFFNLGLFPSVITLKFWLWHSPGICLLYLCLSAKIWSFHAFTFSQLIPVPFLSFKIVFTFFSFVV